ncbi:MAG: hydroxymethylbilane synthase [Oscillospiraceae bacterium]|nr:hydroxymethylbilane synthase [Oscillospiraceae bacterium]
MKQLKIGSRESRLAVIQAELVRDCLAALHPDMSFEIKTYKTTGDVILDRTLDQVGGKGLFTKELEAALLKGEVDLVVHSFKDVPMQVDERIPIVGVTSREDGRDVLVLPEGCEDWDRSRPIGCSSRRRTLQLRALFPGCMVKPVRGNVLTRLSRLEQGEFGALVLAAAGLKRLGLSHRIHSYFKPEEMLPAACQGILALQAGRSFDRSLLEGLHHEDSYVIALAERGFVRALDGGCSSPVAAHAVLEGDRLVLTGLYVEEAGERLHFETACGSRQEAEQLGISLAEGMKQRWCGK